MLFLFYKSSTIVFIIFNLSEIKVVLILFYIYICVCVCVCISCVLDVLLINTIFNFSLKKKENGENTWRWEVVLCW